MPSRFRLTVEAESLAELTGAVTEAAALLQAGDSDRSIAAELAPLAVEPTPAPDYAAAGLTEYQAAEIRAREAEYAIPPMPTPPQPAYVDLRRNAPAVAVAVPPPGYIPQPSAQAAPTAAYAAQAQPLAAQGGTPPLCRLGHGPMEWKGAGLSKSGKGLPLWSCTDRNCREAIWPPR